jgi:ligand-binding sensor domain-containing protein/DNA-binding CsgD family transcriptional regulator
MRTNEFVKSIFSVLLFFICSQLFASPTAPGINNFSRIDYNAASQNWTVSAGTDGFMFFANNNGLLEFDGTNWQLHKLPNETILRAVYAVNNDSIYTSGYREIGYWSRNGLGKLQYHSLVPKAQKYIINNDEFWTIKKIDQKIYFHSFNKLLVYSNDSIESVSLPAFTNTINNVNGRLLLAEQDLGIYELKGEKPVPYLTDPVFKEKTIRFILPYKDQLLIGTASHGIYIYNGKDLKVWNPEWTNYFDENELNRAHLSGNGDLILGTILDGIVVFDKNGHFKAQYNNNNGLQNSTILGITTDDFGNIWLALDRGISFIASAPNKGLHIENIPYVGAIYAAAIYNGKIYLGTNQGLFQRPLSKPEENYQLVPGTQSQIWDLHIIKNQLFVGHNEGTFLVSPNGIKFISKQSGGFAIRQDTRSPDLLIQSTYSNLVVYKDNSGKFELRNYIDNFYDLIRYIEIDHHGTIWASHMHRGIFRIKLNDDRTKKIDLKYYGQHSVFKKDHSLHVFKIENRIVFTTNEKIFTYDDLNDSIITYDFLNKNIGQFATAHRIIEAPGHNYWFITSSGFALFHIQDEKVELIRSYPNSLFKSNPVIDDFENIFPVSETQAIICLENGIAWIDASFADKNPTINYFHPQVREVQMVNKRDEGQFVLPKNKFLKVKNQFNNLIFKYSFPHYTNEPIYYQSFLSGISQEWSEKTTSSVFRFDRLPAGSYDLKVKATDSWGNESQVQTTTIKVLPPWYQTTIARISFVLIFLALLWLLRTWGIRKIKRKEQLEHDRREKELIQLRNEKLNAEVTHKSKELANSTMAIIKKNEFLMGLKETIENQKEQLGSRYPDKYYQKLITKIDNNIESHDDWTIFETNFERAHELFLKKLKEDYPDLTNKDLRLCAYIRMNLSSKEIAPLLGISVRGVENHRYRLRKKMELEHDDNLVDFILKY